MAQLIDPARVEFKLGRYGVGAAKDLKDPTLWQRTQEYRRLVGARLVPLDKRDLAGRLPAGEYHLSRKVDGEFAVLVFADGEALLVNPGGTVRLGLLLLAEAQKQLGRAGVKRALIAGELYYRHPSGARPRVHDVSHAARQPGGTALAVAVDRVTLQQEATQLLAAQRIGGRGLDAERVHLCAGLQQLVMQMHRHLVARRIAHQAQLLACRHRDARHQSTPERSQMRVARVDAIAMVDKDHVAVVVPILHLDDLTVAASQHRHADVGMIIEPLVLPVAARPIPR